MSHDPGTSPAAENFNWLLGAFVQDTPGVLYTIAVSADGLLVANSGGLERSSAEQLSAIVSGLVSLAQGADRSATASSSSPPSGTRRRSPCWPTRRARSASSPTR